MLSTGTLFFSAAEERFVRFKIPIVLFTLLYFYFYINLMNHEWIWISLMLPLNFS